jgi:hypothetical protein
MRFDPGFIVFVLDSVAWLYRRRTRRLGRHCEVWLPSTGSGHAAGDVLELNLSRLPVRLRTNYRRNEKCGLTFTALKINPHQSNRSRVAQRADWASCVAALHTTLEDIPDTVPSSGESKIRHFVSSRSRIESRDKARRHPCSVKGVVRGETFCGNKADRREP